MSLKSPQAGNIHAIISAGIMESPGKTKRQKRFRKRCEIAFLSNGISRRGIGCDFSIRGFFMTTKHPPAPDTVLPMVIHLRDGSTSKVRVRVRRVSEITFSIAQKIATGTFGRGIGVEIIERDANYLHFIRSMLRRGKAFPDSRISIDPS
jgi:hypothetical protein